jgi:hypothetical protein
MLRAIFDREGVGVSLLAAANLTWDGATNLLVKLGPLTHFLMDVGQILVALATAAYFIVKTWRVWQKRKNDKKAADDGSDPADDGGVRDSDPKEG